MGKRLLWTSAYDRRKSSYSVREEQRVLLCLSRILKKARRPKRLLEFFGGVGNTTRVVIERFPGVPVVSWDLDARCVRLLRDLEVTAVRGDSEALAEIEPGDGVLLDYNRFTMLDFFDRKKDIMGRIFSSRPLWVQLNDCGRSKLHINYDAYGLWAWDLGRAYREKYSRMVKKLYGYRLLASSGHCRADQFLFGR